MCIRDRVGSLGLGFAFVVSSQFVTPSSSQQGAGGSVPAVPAIGVAPTASVEKAPLQTSDVGSANLSFLEPYVYDTKKGRRDPFQPTTSEISSSGPTVIRPLQKFDINDIKLVGILWDVKSPKALFLDPSKSTHVVEVDERIGLNNGYVAVIREGEVVVVESTKLRDELVYTTKVLRITK